jgi:ABC-type transporter Mla subunit MlaD
MSNQNYSQSSSGGQRRDGGTGGQDQHSKASVSSVTADAAEKAKQLASDATETVTLQAKRLLDGQLGAGADLIAAIAGATRSASSDLEEKTPQIAKLVHSVADRVDAYSDQMRDQSVEDLTRAASQFTRRQPALVFGLAALAGFFAWRVVKAAPGGSSMTASPSIQPYSDDRTKNHGARTH